MDNQIVQEQLTPLPITPIEPKKKGLGKLIALIIVILALTIGLGYVLLKPKNESIISSVKKSNGVTKIIATPTPIPFVEMTIPHLRSRSYESKLEEKEQVSSNANYTSYLTSYRADGYKINAQLTIPSRERPSEGYPAIVFIHGYIPPASYQTLVNYDSYVDSIASNDIAVLKIDLRGHADSEGQPSGSYYSADYVVDVLSAYQALQNEEDINPEAIGIWGHSMAGNVSLRAMVSKPEIPAVVIWAGAVYTYSDLQKLGIQDVSYRPPANDEQRQMKRTQLFATHGQFDPKSVFWRSVVPTNYLTDIKGAIQLNHAIDDNVVNIEYSRGLDALLTENKITHEIHEYPTGGHNISGASYNKAMQNTVNFFKEYLK